MVTPASRQSSTTASYASSSDAWVSEGKFAAEMDGIATSRSRSALSCGISDATGSGGDAPASVSAIG